MNWWTVPHSHRAPRRQHLRPGRRNEAADAGAGDPRLLYQQAQRSFANDDFAGALGQFDAYLSQFPNNDLSERPVLEGEMPVQLNRYDESVKSFEQLRSNFPTARRYPSRCTIRPLPRDLARLAEAERLMEAVIEQYPVSPAADQARADLRKLRGEE